MSLCWFATGIVSENCDWRRSSLVIFSIATSVWPFVSYASMLLPLFHAALTLPHSCLSCVLLPSFIKTGWLNFIRPCVGHAPSLLQLGMLWKLELKTSQQVRNHCMSCSKGASAHLCQPSCRLHRLVDSGRRLPSPTGKINIDVKEGMEIASKLGVLDEGLPNIRLFTAKNKGISIHTGSCWNYYDFMKCHCWPWIHPGEGTPTPKKIIAKVRKNTTGENLLVYLELSEFTLQDFPGEMMDFIRNLNSINPIYMHAQAPTSQEKVIVAYGHSWIVESMWISKTIKTWIHLTERKWSYLQLIPQINIQAKQQNF